jgi:hypothetical protein
VATFHRPGRGELLRLIWNGTKAAANARKHGVAFTEAATVFADPLSITIDDRGHSVEEQRLVTMGESSSGRILVVVHVDRGDDIRIVSARAATAREKRSYHGKGQR